MTRALNRTAPTARLSDAPLADITDVDAPWPGRMVRVGSNDVYVRHTPPTSASAEPALMVHGLGGSATNWTDYAGLLRDRLDTEAIDLPGFGRSGPAVGNDYRLASQARVVVRYLEQSGRGPVHLIANSMGGAIAILVASTRPDLVRTLTLISPAVPDVKKFRAHPLKADPRMGMLIVPFLGTFALRQLGKIAIEQRAKGTIKLCFADSKRYPQRRMDDAIAEAKARVDMPWAEQSMLRATRGLVSSQFLRGKAAWAAMARIMAPTLVLWGDTDRLVAPDLAPYVAAAIPDSRLLVFEHAGHTAMMELPEESARATLALIEDADRA